MQGIQPRSLSNQELIKYAAMWLDKPEGMPIAWQKEVLRRLTVENPKDYQTDYKTDAKQHALF